MHFNASWTPRIKILESEVYGPTIEQVRKAEIRVPVNGAMGLWLKLGITNRTAIGFIEGILAGLYAWVGFSAVGGLFPLVLIFAVGAGLLYAGHYYTGVLVPYVPTPVKKDWRLSLSATLTALSGFIGIVAVLILKAWGIDLGSAGLVGGILFGGVLHGFLNHKFNLSRQETLAQLRYFRLEGGLHTVTGKGGHKDLTPAQLQRFAEMLLDADIVPAVDRLDVLQALRRQPRYRHKPLAFVLDQKSLAVDPDLAEKAAAAGANVLTGPFGDAWTYSKIPSERIRHLRERYPQTVLIAEVANDSPYATLEVMLASQELDGVLLKPFGGWTALTAPASIESIHTKSPHLLMMVAGGVFQPLAQDVLLRPENLFAAVGFNAIDEQAMAQQIGQYKMARALARLMSGQMHPDAEDFAGYFKIANWATLPVEGAHGQRAHAMALARALHTHYPDFALRLVAPLQEGQPVALSFVPRQFDVDVSNPFGTLQAVLDAQMNTLNSKGSTHFKVWNDGVVIDGTLVPIPGTNGQWTDQHVVLTNTNKPGQGLPAKDCNLCASVIRNNFEDELWMKWGTMNYYFNPFALWPPHPEKPLEAQPYAIVAAWNGEHRSQQQIYDVELLRTYREQWMGLNASPGLSGDPLKFWMAMNGWNYGNKDIHGGASQDHIHAQMFKTRMWAQETPVTWGANDGKIQSGIAHLLIDPLDPSAPGVQGMAFQADKEDTQALQELDETLSRLLKSIVGEGASFDVLYFETPEGKIRVFVAGRSVGRPQGALNARGVPEVLGRINIFATGFDRFYQFTSEQAARVDASATSRELALYLKGERDARRLKRQSDADIYTRYYSEIHQVTYTPEQNKAILQKLIHTERSTRRNHAHLPSLRSV